MARETHMIEPLTAEEEAAYRAVLAGPYRNNRWSGDHVARLLATLDAARSARAATPARSDAGDGLDVERLQRAYEACDVEFMTSAETLSSFLRRVAAEYARLSKSTGEGGPTRVE